MLAKEKTGQHDGLRAAKKRYTSELTVIEITLGQLLRVTKEQISQVSWVKSSIAPFSQNQPVLCHTTLL